MYMVELNAASKRPINRADDNPGLSVKDGSCYRAGSRAYRDTIQYPNVEKLEKRGGGRIQGQPIHIYSTSNNPGSRPESL